MKSNLVKIYLYTFLIFFSFYIFQEVLFYISFLFFGYDFFLKYDFAIYLTQAIILAITFLLVLVLKNIGNRRRYLYNKTKDSYFFIVLLIILILFITKYIILFSNENIYLSNIDKTKMSLISGILFFFNHVIIQPINEELVFRKIILEKLITDKSKVLIGLLISSLYFSILHIKSLDISYYNIFSLFIFGLLMGIVFLRMGIVYTILAHIIYNLLFFILENENFEAYLYIFQYGYIRWIAVGVSYLILMFFILKNYRIIIRQYLSSDELCQEINDGTK